MHFAPEDGARPYHERTPEDRAQLDAHVAQFNQRQDALVARVCPDCGGMRIEAGPAMIAAACAVGIPVETLMAAYEEAMQLRAAGVPLNGVLVARAMPQPVRSPFGKN